MHSTAHLQPNAVETSTSSRANGSGLGRPLRIGVAIAQRQWHGGERQAGLLAEGLAIRGHRCTIISPESSECTRRMRDRLPIITYAGRGRDPLTLWRLRRQLRALQLDVLHLNDPHALTSVGLASYGLPIPARFIARRVGFALKRPLLYHHLADGVVCVSHDVVQACRRSGIDDERLLLVPDGVDPQRMRSGQAAAARERFAIARDEPLLLAVGRLVEPKGFQTLIDALPRIRRQVSNVRVLIAGEGKYRGRLQQQIDRLQVNRSVCLIGQRNDIPDLMAAATLLVVPSYHEGLCSSIIDAMFAGCPVVASRTGGIPDLLDDRPAASEPACGWLVPPGDAEELAQAVCAALGDRETRRDRARLGRRRAQREFTAQRMVERTENLYARVLSRLSVHLTDNQVDSIRA